MIGWGTRIAILYISFAALIIFLVVLSFSKKVDLVSKDYYQQELNYDKKLQAINNFNNLGQIFEIKTENNTIEIKYPEYFNGKNISGNIHLFRPSDSSLDKKAQINSEKGLQKIQTIGRGYYQIKIDLTCDGKNYFFEKEIFLNK